MFGAIQLNYFKKNSTSKFLHQNHLKIEEDAKITIKSGVVTVTGQLGTLVRDLSHHKLDIEYNSAEEKTALARCWFGNRNLLSALKLFSAI